jgi:hypothetical protein
VRDLALDPITGDLLLDDTGRARLTTPGQEAVQQRLQLRLSLWQGEYPLDTSVGVPYGSLLGRKGAEVLASRTLRAAAESCPGLAQLTAFSFALDAERHATVTLAGRASNGEPVSLEAFAAGSL